MNLEILLRTILAFIKTKLGVYIRPRRYVQIFSEIERVQPRNIMEVGTWNGVRAKNMIQHASKFCKTAEIQYIGFDLFKTMTKELYAHEISKMPPSREEVFAYLETSGAKINLYAGYTQDTMRMVGSLPKVDFVFIDGGHATDTVLNDWKGVQKVMHDKTVVIFDDYWQNRKDGPKVVIDTIDRNIFNVEILPKIDVFFNPDFGRLVISLVKVTLK